MLSWFCCRLVPQVSFTAEQLLTSVSSAPQGIAESAAGLSASTQPAAVRAAQGHRVDSVFTLRAAWHTKLRCSRFVTRVLPCPPAAAQGADGVTAIGSEAQSQAFSSRRHSRAPSGDGSEAGFSDGGHSYVSGDSSRSGEHTQHRDQHRAAGQQAGRV